MSNVLFSDSISRGSIEEKILFNGKANQMNQEYDLLDDINNYKYLLFVTGSDYVGSSGNLLQNAYIRTLLVTPNDFASTVALTMEFANGNIRYMISISHVNSTKIKIPYTYISSSFKDVYLSRIVGFK